MKRVVLESPFKGEDWSQTRRNIAYLRLCMHDSLRRGEAPYASHALYTQPGVLDDRDEKERQWGIEAGFAWRSNAELTVVYTDFGISRGMQYGIEHAQQNGTPVEYRTLFEGLAEDVIADQISIALGPFPE